jgi:hypothetical protein
MEFWKATGWICLFVLALFIAGQLFEGMVVFIILFMGL